MGAIRTGLNIQGSRQALWRVPDAPGEMVKKPGQLCGSLGRWGASSILLGGIRFLMLPPPASLCWGVWKKQWGKWEAFCWSLLKKQLPCSISLPPFPPPHPTPILLSVAGCNYAVNFGGGVACKYFLNIFFFFFLELLG